MFKLSKRAIAIRNVITTSVIILIGIMVLVGIWYHFHRMKPVKNPHPVEYITLHGHIDKGLRVKLSAFYETTNPSCQHYVDIAEGALAARDTEVLVKAKPDDKGNYKLKLPLDAYKSGICKWEINSIVYYVGVEGDKKVDEDRNWIVGFDNNGEVLSNDAYLTYNCQIEGNVQMACGLPKSDIYSSSISPKTKSVIINFRVSN